MAMRGANKGVALMIAKNKKEIKQRQLNQRQRLKGCECMPEIQESNWQLSNWASSRMQEAKLIFYLDHVRKPLHHHTQRVKEKGLYTDHRGMIRIRVSAGTERYI